MPFCRIILSKIKKHKLAYKRTKVLLSVSPAPCMLLLPCLSSVCVPSPTANSVWVCVCLTTWAWPFLYALEPAAHLWFINSSLAGLKLWSSFYSVPDCFLVLKIATLPPASSSSTTPLQIPLLQCLFLSPVFLVFVLASH